MEQKIRELIAVGAAVAGHCVPCLDFHLQLARKFGASEEEIATAIETGRAVEKGAMDAMKQAVNERIGTKEQSSPCCGSPSPRSKGSSCCG